MKKLILILLTIHSSLFTLHAFTQSPCLPEGIIFTTQAQIDSFQINYPGCTEIEGDVTINGVDISNLSGLNVLSAIGGDFLIGDSFSTYSGNPLLTSFTGLENLTSIGGNLSIIGNDILTSLSGLENLTSIGGTLQIGGPEDYMNLYGNPSLVSLTGLDNLTYIGNSLGIYDNDNLTSLSALNDLTSIGQDITIWGNEVLPNLSGLENLTSIAGTLHIGNWDSWAFGGIQSLESLTGLDNVNSIGGNLVIHDDNILMSLTGLDNLNSIEGSLIIGFEDMPCNPSLTSLTGLGNLNSIGGDLKIVINESLTSLMDLDNLNSIGGNLLLLENTALTSLSGLDNIDAGSISDLHIMDNSSLSTCEVQSVCDYLANPNGEIQINFNAPGCTSPEEVMDSCMITTIEKIVLNESFTISHNPLESSSIITYNLNKKSFVTISIFELSGRLIRTLVNEYQQKGEEKVMFPTDNLKPGVYFCKLKTNEGIQTRKIIKL